MAKGDGEAVRRRLSLQIDERTATELAELQKKAGESGAVVVRRAIHAMYEREIKPDGESK